MSVYPLGLDTDLELPRVDNNITEISGDAINALRDAVFNIESALGLSPAGNKPSLAERINVSIDANGNIKSSAISSLGLVTLPITNTQIASNAAIAESKLNLDFSTQSLKNLISSLQTDTASLQSSVSSITSNFNLHIIGQKNFHDGYHIKVNTGTFVGITGLGATTIGAAINELADILFGDNAHIDFSLPGSIKHRANHISINTTNFTTIDRTVENVQEAFDSIDQEILGQQGGHVDNFHANGILKSINSGEFFNPNQLKFSDNSSSYSAGSTVVTIPSIVSFSNTGIKVGDILEITGAVLDVGTYKIRALGPLVASDTLGNLPTLASNQLSVFHVFQETQASTSIKGYQAASVSSENAPLACSIRTGTTLIDTPTILNPDAARVVSLGFNPAIINGDGYNIHLRVGVGTGQTRELTITNLNRERLAVSQASIVDATSVAERINAFVSDPVLGHHFPISAFRVGNEIAIAHNVVGPEFTLEVFDGYSGNFAMGLDAYGADITDIVIKGNEDNLFSVNGLTLSTLRTVVDGYAKITSTTDVFSIFDEDGAQLNPIVLGIAPGDVVHISNHPTTAENGSYTIEAVTSTTIEIISPETISAPISPTQFDIRITDSHISLNVLDNVETDNGIVQLWVDEVGKVLLHQRLAYGTGLGAAIQIISLSSGFPVGDVLINIGSSGIARNFNIISGSVSGTTSTIHEDFEGTFKLYHPNNIDFMLIKIGAGAVGVGSETVSIYDNINDDEALAIAALHFNGEKLINNVLDLRQFGTLSADQVRDDFIDVFSQRPVYELRSDGVARGFDIVNMPFNDSVTNMQALPLNGGVAYINGVRCVVETQKVVIPSYDSAGILLPNRTVIIGINEFGTIRSFDDTLNEILYDGYNSSAEFGKILPLYAVNIVDGLITTTTDIRKFINNLDAKLPLIVDATNNIVGNFRTLEGALLYAAAYPSAERLSIRITNSVFPSRKLTVPPGVSILGEAAFGGNKQHAIINRLDLNDNLIELSGHNRIENIRIESEAVTMDGALVFANGSNVDINKCSLGFTDANPIATSSEDSAIELGTLALQDVRITNNRINRVFSGIVSNFGCERLLISQNEIQNIAGTSAEAHGIFVGTSDRAVDHTFITNNTVLVDNIGPGSDIRGISVDIGQTIGTLQIIHNSVDHEAGTTMTNGIRVENSAVTGNMVEELVMHDNTINGIKLDSDDIWGIYVSNITSGSIHHNIIKNVGQAGNTDYGFIRAQNFTYLDIDNNILENGAVTRGIDVSGVTNKVKITNNTLKGLGTSAIYIFGAGQHSVISDNTLTGSGLDGIRWTGTNSTINDNNLNSDGVSYAFSQYGIITLTTGIDVCHNTITGMAFSENSIGISNGGAGRDRSKIIGNTISGDKMSAAIELFGADHLVNDNRLFNTSASSSNTNFIELNSVSASTISDNKIHGAGTNAILEIGTVSNNTFANNKITATLGTQAFNLPNASECFFNGNSVPDTSTSSIGTGTSADTNTYGINQNLSTSISLSFANGSSANHTNGALHWWQLPVDGYLIGNTAISSRELYFAIDQVPSGARLVTVNVRGNRTGANDTLTADVIRQSITASFGTTAISAVENITSISTFNGTSAGTGLITITTSSDLNLIDYSRYAYAVRITSTGGSVMSHVRGIKLNFRY